MSQIEEALSVAAEELISRPYFVDVVGDDRRVGKAKTALRRRIIRFLENIPDDMSAIDIREGLSAFEDREALHGRD